VTDMTQAQMDAELSRLGHYRCVRAVEIGKMGEPDQISGALLLAIGSVETNCQNIVGGGSFVSGKWTPTYVDRGFFQINAHYHKGFLASVPGCLSHLADGKVVSSWSPELGRLAIEAGYVPQFSPAAFYVVEMLRNSIEFALDCDVLTTDVQRFAVAAHNAGPGGALKGYRENDVDAYTTGRNYSERVLARRKLVNNFLARKKIG